MSFLTRLRDLDAKATPGPWQAYFTSHGDPYVTDSTGMLSHQVAKVDTSPEDYGRANAEFIAFIRNRSARLAGVLDLAYSLSRCLDEDDQIALRAALLALDTEPT